MNNRKLMCSTIQGNANSGNITKDHVKNTHFPHKNILGCQYIIQNSVTHQRNYFQGYSCYKNGVQLISDITVFAKRDLELVKAAKIKAVQANGSTRFVDFTKKLKTSAVLPSNAQANLHCNRIPQGPTSQTKTAKVNATWTPDLHRKSLDHKAMAGEHCGQKKDMDFISFIAWRTEFSKPPIIVSA